MLPKPDNRRRTRLTVAALAGLMLCFVWLSGLKTSYAQQLPDPLFSLVLNFQLFDAEWSADGQYFAIASQNGVFVYSDTLELIASFQGHTSVVTSVTWSPTGDYLASAGGGGDNTIRIWQFNRTTGAFSQIQVMTIQTSVVLLVKWSPDGTKLASFSVSDSSLTRRDRVLGMVDVWNTQTWIRINEEPQYLFAPQRALTWSPDSNQLAVAGQGGAAVIDLDTYQYIYYSDNFGTYGSEVTDVDWSNTDQLALAGSRLFILNANTGQVINTWDMLISQARWHPDGSLLAIGNAASDPSTKIFDPTTGEILETFSSDSNLWSMEWNSSGTRLATVSRNGTVEIWDTTNISISTGTPTVTPQPSLTPSLTRSPTATPATSTPTPVPANQLTFAVETSTTGFLPQLFASDLNGANVHPLLTMPDISLMPTWSPAGTRLAFAGGSSSDELLHIYVANSDGSNLQIITTGAGSNYDPAWSPDGLWIVFTSERDGNREIYATRADGTTINNPLRLTNHPADDYNPDYSSQNTITFVSTRSSAGVPDIFTMSILGGNIQNWTNTPTIAENQPVWSPSGRQIAFIASENGNSALNVINADGTGRSQYVAASDSPFDWSPDGSQLVIISPENTINIFEPATGYNIVVLNDTNPKFGVSWSNGQGSVALPSPTATPSAHARHTAGPPVPASPYPASATP